MRETTKPIRQDRPVKLPVGHEVRFSDDGKLLVSLGRNVVVMDVDARKRLSTSRPLSHPAHASFSPDAANLAVKSASGRIAVIDPRTGAVAADLVNQKEGEGSPVHFTPDRAALVDGSWDGLFAVRDWPSGQILQLEHFPGEMIPEVSTDCRRHVFLCEHRPKRLAETGPPRLFYGPHLAVQQQQTARAAV